MEQEIAGGFRHGQVFIVILAIAGLQDLNAVGFQQGDQVAVCSFVREAVAQKGDLLRIFRFGIAEHSMHLPPQGRNHRIGAAHNRVHVTVHEIDFRKFFCQNIVYPLVVDRHKMMDAAGENHHHAGFFRQLPDDPFHPVLQHFFHVPFQDVLFAYGDGGHFVHAVQLRGGEHYAPEAAGRTDENLVTLRYQGGDVDDVPHAPNRGGVGQPDVGGIFVIHIPNLTKCSFHAGAVEGGISFCEIILLNITELLNHGCSPCHNPPAFCAPNPERH